MPTCFLKRVLPFVLTLVIGLTLGKFLGVSSWQSNRVVTPLQSSVSEGGGAGLGESPAEVADDNRIFKANDVYQKALILWRAQPQYTEEAREQMVTGTVVLRAVFTADGQVTNIRAVSGLPYGLTEKAIAAARQIKFTPAIKDGRSVSQYIQIEYNFSLY